MYICTYQDVDYASHLVLSPRLHIAVSSLATPTDDTVSRSADRKYTGVERVWLEQSKGVREKGKKHCDVDSGKPHL